MVDSMERAVWQFARLLGYHDGDVEAAFDALTEGDQDHLDELAGAILAVSAAGEPEGPPLAKEITVDWETNCLLVDGEEFPWLSLSNWEPVLGDRHSIRHVKVSIPTNALTIVGRPPQRVYPED